MTARCRSAAPREICTISKRSCANRRSKASYGIGHTRWATHGRPTEENAHPHRDCTGEIVVVHNGIVENYVELKRQLEREGHKFVTETDTEVIAHLVEKYMKDGGPLEEAVRKAVEAARRRLFPGHSFLERPKQDRCGTHWVRRR